MAEFLTREEMRHALTEKGVAAAAIERVLANQFGASVVTAPGVVQTNYVQIGAALPFPIRVTLPWSALCSDNERESPTITLRNGKPVPYMVKTARFKVAREKVREIARAAMTVDGVTFSPLTHMLSLSGRIYTPTQRRVDATNFAKGVQDAFSKIVYVDDQQLRDVRWLIVGMDMDAPRAEIEIAPLAGVSAVGGKK